MAIDYKKQAINCYITEMYCDTKYPSKYKDLIERASVMPEMNENNNPVSIKTNQIPTLIQLYNIFLLSNFSLGCDSGD